MNLDDILGSLMEKSAAVAEVPSSAKTVTETQTITSDVKPEGQEKSAAFKSGADMAKEIMEKVASIKIEQNKGEDMNKQASQAGKDLAQALLTKLASVGDVNTAVGFADGVVPNKTQADLAAQVAEHEASFQPTPGTDGKGNGGTINQIFDAIVADAAARTGAVVQGQSASAPAEGAIDHQAPNQEQVDDSQEKMAAAMSLVNSGVDFDDAVALVKAASDELEFEHEAQVKQAAMNELMDAGVDFDLAVAMVKEAGKMEAVKSALGSAAGAAHAYGKAGVETVKATGANLANRAKAAYGKAAPAANAKVQSATGASSYKELGANVKAHLAKNKGKYAAGVGGAAAAGGAAAYASREKKAALDALIDAGIDYDMAAEYVSQL